MNYIQKAILIAGAAFCFNLTMSAQDITLKNKNITVKEAMEELKRRLDIRLSSRQKM